jgi:hypothetical protein
MHSARVRANAGHNPESQKQNLKTSLSTFRSSGKAPRPTALSCVCLTGAENSEHVPELLMACLRGPFRTDRLIASIQTHILDIPRRLLDDPCAAGEVVISVGIAWRLAAASVAPCCALGCRQRQPGWRGSCDIGEIAFQPSASFIGVIEQVPSDRWWHSAI